jgi:hypothetical protein
MAKFNKLGNYNVLWDQSAAWVIKNLVFVLFLGLLVVIYIANYKYAKKSMHQVRVLKEEVMTLERMHNSIESDIRAQSRYSEVSSKIKEKGLGDYGTQPIVVE